MQPLTIGFHVSPEGREPDERILLDQRTPALDVIRRTQYCNITFFICNIPHSVDPAKMTTE